MATFCSRATWRHADYENELVLYWQVISRHQLLINASIISSTGIDVNASKGETLLGYLTAIWFNSRNINSMWDNHTGHWLQPETILTYLQRCPKQLRLSGIYLIAIPQEATINYNMCSCSWFSFSGLKKLKIVQITGNWKPCKVCGRFHQPILTGEMWQGRCSKLAGG